MPPTLAPGQQAGGGRFILVRPLGRGGMGVVWLATDTQLREEVALKFLPPEIRGDSVALDSVRHEAARSRQLSHPNIVRIHDLHGDDDGTLLLSMEFVDGKNLNDLRLEQPGRRFAWTTLAPWVKQLCDALDYAHGERLIHRDLKPANLMVDVRGRLKLADFGIAATAADSMSRVSLRQPTSGTLMYMSPQQLDGRSPRATDDIYSLGTTLYDLLTGRPPFQSGDIPFQIRQLPPEPIQDRLAELGIQDDVPPAVAALVMSCLAKDPDQRPQHVRAVAEWLGLSGGTESHPAREIPPREPALGRRLPRMAWIGGLAVVLAVAAALGVGLEPWRAKVPRGVSVSVPPTGSPPASLPESGISPVEPGFLPIFNGRDLSGWSGDSRIWSVNDGVLDGSLDAAKGHPERSYLVWTNGMSPDFELRLRFRFTSELRGGRGTLLVGFRGSARTVSGVPDAGYLFKVSGVNWGRGALCREGAQYPPLVWRGQKRTIKPGEERDAVRLTRSPSVPDPVRLGEWNDLVVRAQGERVSTEVNGVITAELLDEDVKNRPSGAFIMLGARHGGKSDQVQVQFTNLRLKPLSPP
ncbi:MAG: protein kinase [Verrucomicrobiales bacterium]|nr:protein kinase [Verrucomicrobiales bacterium]